MTVGTFQEENEYITIASEVDRVYQQVSCNISIEQEGHIVHIQRESLPNVGNIFFVM